MRVIFACATVFLAFATPGPALADEVYAVTPSGATEAFFDKSVVETSDFLANQCIDLGWTMISSTATTVICEAPVSVGSALLHALGGPRYSTPLRMYYRFNLAAANGHTRVQVTSWQETTTAFGQTQQTEIASENYHNNVMFFFANIGGNFPPGTTFPNHAVAGFQAEAVEEPTAGLRVTAVEKGSPAEAGDLRVGDVVIRLAGERTRNTDDVMDGLEKATRGSDYEVKALRDGQEITLRLPVRYREQAGPLAEPTWQPEPEPAPAVFAAPFSVAEELARFATLRDQGVLTNDEFEAQKARLLGASN